MNLMNVGYKSQKQGESHNLRAEESLGDIKCNLLSLRMEKSSPKNRGKSVRYVKG